MTKQLRNRPTLSLALGLILAAPVAAAAGTLVCWGDNGYDQCNLPAPNSGWELIGAGDANTLAQKSDGTLFCWGFQIEGACALGGSDRDFVSIDIGYDSGVGLHADGTVGGWGASGPPFPNQDFIAVTIGNNHSLYLKSDGSIVTNGYPPPAPNSGYVAIGAGYFYSLGVKADGSIVGWGRDCGPAGDPCAAPAPNLGYVAAAGGWRHSCGLKADGSVVCWGSNVHGQLDVPAPNDGFVAISAGVDFTVGLKDDGSIVAWGVNTAGQLDVPEPNSGFVAIAAGGAHVVALRGESCAADPDCDDGIFCNGGETCAGGVCQPGGGNPCEASLCRESDDQCVGCLTSAHCDDGLYCNGVEVCGGTGTCGPGPDPCPGMGCDESLNVCSDGGPEVWVTFSDHVFIPQLNAWAMRRDIVARNVATGNWSMVVEGSDLFFDSLVIDGMARLPDGSILLSFTAPANIQGMTGGPSGTLLDDSDIVRFIPTSLGWNTAGALVFYFDGSDVGLTTDDEDVDAIALTTGGQLVISTVGAVSAGGASGVDADLLRFAATSLGAATTGTFAMHFDGSDVGLSSNDEDVDAAAIPADGTHLLSTLGNFHVPGASGGDEDIVRFTPVQLGPTTSGSYAMYLDLSFLGAAADVGGVEYKE